MAPSVLKTSSISTCCSGCSASPDFRARAAATRVLCYWRDRRARRASTAEEAGRRSGAASAAGGGAGRELLPRCPQAVEIPLISADYPTDKYLDYVRTETMRALDPYVKRAIAEGWDRSASPIRSPARYFLKNVSTDDLLKMKRTQAVYLELLFRPGIRDELRQQALAGLAKLEHKRELAVLLDAIRGQDQQPDNQDESVVFDLVRLLTDRDANELAARRAASWKRWPPARNCPSRGSLASWP